MQHEVGGKLLRRHPEMSRYFLACCHGAKQSIAAPYQDGDAGRACDKLDPPEGTPKVRALSLPASTNIRKNTRIAPETSPASTGPASGPKPRTARCCAEASRSRTAM